MCDYQGYEFGAGSYPDSVCIDAALAHVVRWAYRKGRDDAIREELDRLASDAGLKELP